MNRGEVEKLVAKSYQIGMAQIREEIVRLGCFLSKIPMKNFLEIGSKLGGTFYLFTKLCNQSGKRISIDLQNGDFGGWALNDHPYLENVLEKRNRFLSSVDSGVHLILSDSHDKATVRQVKEVLGEEKLDFLFLDGDHTFEGVMKDFEMYRDFVSEDGYIGFHDINDTEHHRKIDVWVGRAWDTIKTNKLEFNENQHWAGIGLVRKRDLEK